MSRLLAQMLAFERVATVSDFLTVVLSDAKAHGQENTVRGYQLTTA